MSDERINAPWTYQQVRALNQHQSTHRRHPYTCGGDHGTQEDRELVATVRGWICRYCDYTQTWAHNPFAFPDEPPPSETPHEFRCGMCRMLRQECHPYHPDHLCTLPNCGKSYDDPIHT